MPRRKGVLQRLFLNTCNRGFLTDRQPSSTTTRSATTSRTGLSGWAAPAPPPATAASHLARSPRRTTPRPSPTTRSGVSRTDHWLLHLRRRCAPARRHHRLDLHRQLRRGGRHDLPRAHQQRHLCRHAHWGAARLRQRRVADHLEEYTQQPHFHRRLPLRRRRYARRSGGDERRDNDHHQLHRYH